MKKEVITIDLGSNSFRVLKFDCINYKIIDEYHQVVGLADGLVNSGKISIEACKRVVEALKIASEKLNFDPKDAVCITTAAARKATNSKEVLEYIKENGGAKFKIIDSNEESRLTLLAIKHALKREKIDSKNFILLDIGGGSTELIVSKDEEFFSKSFDFGIVTLTQNSLKDKNKLFEELELYKKEIKEFLNTLSFSIEDFIFIATAGTPTTIASIKLGYSYFNYDKNVVNGTVLNLQDLENSLNLLKETSFESLIKIAGKGRIEYLEVGTYIYRMFFELLNKKESIVLDDGLREGIAIDFAIKSKA
ncbi:Ppx/GppA phosphatase family protein [Arcobacter porcinus]|uniref:Exopolyphosphatase n=1 Tax=Arcobacter porcinus TaxID=1935204 RepID=A0ABX2YDV5_9BACT|nr:exopolyphosphatase [Arcobacter porcinus]OCL82076.1 Exopolyphosphatase [Arcobacter porcinus]OCL84996.1 Exopolyphosphatase [Arcobacter porcinus]OCL93121.1 Exopolyphosphatase [Arcobacter porcinus]